MCRMTAKQPLMAGLVSVLTLFHSMVYAQGDSILMQRCEQDSLDVASARARGDWAIKCSYIPASKRILMDSWNDGTDMAGRPLYPIFVNADKSAVWKAPVDVNAECNRPSEFPNVMYCTSSCYTPEQLVLFEDGYSDILSATKTKKTGLITLTESSIFGNFEFQSQSVDHYSESLQDGDHLIYSIATKSGGSLRVTPNHPLLRAYGQIVDAETLKAGESLVRADGSSDEIVKIAKSKYHGRVYNVAPQSRDRVSNLIVAQGFVSGSNRYQNWILDDLNRQVMRSNLDASLFQ